MTDLTKNIRTHIIELADKTSIHITQSQYDLYKQEVQIKKHNEFMEIRDIDTDKIVFD
jgi:hypothetical protein